MSFQFDFTLEKFQQIISNSKSDKWFKSVCDILPRYEIDTQPRVAAFLAQTGVESNDYNTLTENLNYTADQLLKTFPYYFKSSDKANAYAHQPEKIANLVYSNRLGNAGETSGDGWKYRGRGIIQITGKYNYSQCSKAILNNNDLVTNPDLLTTTDYAIWSACWFWQSKDLNSYADQGDIDQMTYLINGGYNGYEARLDKYNVALSVL